MSRSRSVRAHGTSQAGGERSVGSAAPISAIVAWSLWLASAATMLGGMVLAVLPVDARAATLPWWVRVCAWVQIAALVTVGRLIVSRHHRHLIGWSFLAASALLTLYYGTRELLQLQRVPLLALVEWLVGTRWLWIPAVGVLTVVVPLIFPDGTLPSRRWRPLLAAAVLWLAVLTVARVVRPGPLLDVPDRLNPLGIGGPFGQAATVVADRGLVLWPVFLLAALAVLIIRFRQTATSERDRVRWLTLAMVVMIGSATIDKVLYELTGNEPAAIFYFSSAAQVLVPVVAGVAVLKFRLYGIDLVVHRALVYGSLTVLIGAVYVALVGGAGVALGSSGPSNVVLPLVATTIVAVTFQPVRERLERVASRVVYGQRATPYEVLSSFAEGMALSIADDAFLNRMARVLTEGVGAASVEVWIRTGDHLHQAARHPSASGFSSMRLVNGHLPPVAEDQRMIEVCHKGELLGALVIRKRPGDPLRATEAKLVSDVAQHAGLVLANGRLATELAARLDELQASRARIVAATDAERRRLERNLHDGAQQRLVNVSLLLGLAKTQEQASPTPELAAIVDEASAELNEALAELRELARGIHPAVLTEAGLAPAVRSLAGRSKAHVFVAAVPSRRLAPPVEVAAYFVIAEALTNIVKYAEASQATISLTDTSDELMVEIADDGIGGADMSKGSGLRGLLDRVGAINGTLSIDSQPGCGTKVVARIPCG